MKRCFAALLAGCMLISWSISGCVRTEQRREPWRSTTLMIGRDATGVTIQWKSVKDQRYTIVYNDSRNPKAPWQPLPQATELVGTGEVMTVRDESPGAFYRNYMPQTLIPVSQEQFRSLQRDTRRTP